MEPDTCWCTHSGTEHDDDDERGKFRAVCRHEGCPCRTFSPAENVPAYVRAVAATGRAVEAP